LCTGLGIVILISKSEVAININSDLAQKAESTTKDEPVIKKTNTVVDIGYTTR